MRKEHIIRHTFIIKILKKQPLSFKEIQKAIIGHEAFMNSKIDYCSKTFKRDTEEIKLIYGIEIEYNKSANTYEITNTNCGGYVNIEEIEQRLDTMHILNLSNRFGKYIDFEKRIPICEQDFRDILDAIDNRNTLKFKYQKYNEPKSTDRLVEPYKIKEFKKRWFLVAKDLNDRFLTIKSFALDRIIIPQKQTTIFKNFPDSDVTNKFSDFYGVNTYSKGKVEDIKLSFTNEKADYVEKIPLHASQKTELRTEKETIFTLRLNPTDEFVSELLSYGRDVKVLEPKSLAQEVAEMHRKAFENYL